jgi:translocation protein SEC63
VTVALVRRNLSILFEDEKGVSNAMMLENGELVGGEEEEVKKKATPWQRPVKRGKKAANKKSGGGAKKVVTTTTTTAAVKKETAAVKDSPRATQKKKNDSESGSEDEDQEEMSGEESDEVDDVEVDEKSANNDSSEPEKDDDNQLEKLQSDVAMRRQRLLEGKSQISHPVHAPYLPQEKQEYWWAYITDRKQQMLLTAPYHVTNLVEREEIQLKFTAPFKPGFYTFAVCLRSDSYFGFDQMKDIKV